MIDIISSSYQCKIALGSSYNSSSETRDSSGIDATAPTSSKPSVLNLVFLR